MPLFYIGQGDLAEQQKGVAMRHLLSLVTTTNFRDNGRRKINKIAAISAGFSLLLLGIVAVMFGASSQPAYAENPPAKFRDAIDSSQSPIDAKTVSGSVKKLLAVPATGNISATADLGVGLANVTVYAQWSEGSKSKGRWASPIYKGTTDVNGNFKIKMLPYTDVNGVKRTFDGEVGLHPGECITKNPDLGHQPGSRKSQPILGIRSASLSGRYSSGLHR